MVVAAPADSEPTTPIGDWRDDDAQLLELEDEPVESTEPASKEDRPVPKRAASEGQDQDNEAPTATDSVVSEPEKATKEEPESVPAPTTPEDDGEHQEK
jgi:hypothetical protein